MNCKNDRHPSNFTMPNKMLRLFILCSLFVICVERIICIEATKAEDFANGKKIGRNIHKHLKRHKREEADQDTSEDQYAQIDLTNFIKEADDEIPTYENSLTKNYSEDDSLDSKDIEESFNSEIENYEDLDKNRNSHSNNLNYDDSERSHFIQHSIQKNEINNKIDKGNILATFDVYYDDLKKKRKSNVPVKKSIFKKVRIPFFSSNKCNSSTLTKNDGKKTLTCLTCPTNKAKDPKKAELLEVKSQSNVDGSLELNKENNKDIKKRSYIESLCPECRKRFTAYRTTQFQIRDTLDYPIHNSRQYYQTDNLFNTNNNKEDFNVNTKSDKTETNYYGKRKRRDEEILSDKERQTKELDEVERKINNLELKLPKFSKA